MNVIKIIIFYLCILNINKGYSKQITISNYNDNVDPGILVVQGLLSRILGQSFIPYFNLVLSNTSNSQYFEISSQSSNSATYITVASDSTVNLATGVNHYLKYFGQCSFTWTGDQCSLNATSLPPVTGNVNIPILSKYRYYMNVCTFGYSTVWWDWPRWEREIDWMALNGYNLPLAFVGQEYVWYSVFANLGLSQAEIQAWLTGPAFLPWNRMGNVNQWAGNLTLAWMGNQRDLQIQILKRMREYGMQAVLPGFAGHVPQALQTYYPTANIKQLEVWNVFNGTYYLNPEDPLFAQITTSFIQTQSALYGTDHFYNFDPFNEVEPPSNNTSYLRNSSRSMYNNMIAADPSGIWVLQGWFFVYDTQFWKSNQTEAFFSGVPIGKMIVLDLWADVSPGWNLTNYFYGHDWIWCMLHNFGGRSGMYGKIPYISTSPIQLRQLAPNMVGTGLTPEAIEQNVIVYEVMNEMSWRATPPNLEEWVNQYVTRRYGKYNPTLAETWYELVGTVFNCTIWTQGPVTILIGVRPQLNFTTTLYYDPIVISRAWSAFLSINDTTITNTTTFSFDLTEITTQALSNIFMANEEKMNSAFYNNSLEEFDLLSSAMLGIIQDVNTIVSTQEMLLVGNWTARARETAPVNESTDLYEMNARNQITLWGPSYSKFNDYAFKLWSGLIEDLYLARWTLFIKELQQSLVTRQAFEYTQFQSNCEALEENWNLQTNIYPTTPTTLNSYEISKNIYENSITSRSGGLII